MNSQELTKAVHDTAPRLLVAELGDDNSEDWLSEILCVADRLGLSREELIGDIRSFLYQRILFAALPDDDGCTNFRDRQRIIRHHLLERMRPHGTTSLSDALLDVLAHVSAGMADGGSGVRDSVSSYDSYALAQLLTDQGQRCAVCGIPLVENTAVADPHFVGGVEVVGVKSLEHTLPFYLFGNRGAYEVLCLECNGCKRENLGWHEDGKVFAGNTAIAALDSRVQRRVMFWTLYRTRRCGVSECDRCSKSSTLYVEGDHRSRVMFGALRVVCRDHAMRTSRWLHDGCGGLSATSDEDS